jgi:hypothetical protein
MSQVLERERDKNCNEVNGTRDKRHDNFYLMVRSSIICLSTLRCSVPMDEDCTQSLSSDPKIKLEYHGSILCLTISWL